MSGTPKENQTSALESRLSRLEEVERKIMLIMQHAGNALEELSKDRPIVKQVEGHTHNFHLIVKEVESEMNTHINYLNQISAGLPYEGNTHFCFTVFILLMESDPSVSSTVVESELPLKPVTPLMEDLDSVCKTQVNGVEENIKIEAQTPSKPSWHIVSQNSY
ncbi:Mediator complex subunit 11 [Fasciola gigantica]|uniref:Mediator of RNA polymerase II transcription subunit 11 n=1 Tax=Fasciola gigantica TaxID=46835 RepID=A0A504YYV8_FASGI|nr:Mediator complex subunit 11 [Fasciola gigantica]